MLKAILKAILSYPAKKFLPKWTMLLQTLKANSLLLSITEICITHLPYFKATPFIVFNNYKCTKLKITFFL